MGVSKPVDHPGADRSHGDLLRQWIRRRRLGPVVKALFGLSNAMLSLVLFAAGAACRLHSATYCDNLGLIEAAIWRILVILPDLPASG